MGGHIHGASGHNGAPGNRPSRCEVSQHYASMGNQAEYHSVLGLISTVIPAAVGAAVITKYRAQ